MKGLRMVLGVSDRSIIRKKDKRERCGNRSSFIERVGHSGSKGLIQLEKIKEIILSENSG